MKKSIFLLMFILYFSFGFSQVTKTANGNSTTEFVAKDQQPINITNLTDGDHSFYSSTGTKLVLTIKNEKVVSSKYFSVTGKDLNVSTQSSARKVSFCNTCTIIRYPNGTTDRICSYTICPDVDEINKSLNTR